MFQLKKDYLSGVGDSLDLVVVGAYHGKGKRTNVYGAFLLACYDPDSENFQTICKIGTGFSDEILLSFYETLKPLEIETARSDLEVGGAKPDVWFEPKIVWEVLTADLSLSPVYTAGHGLVSRCGSRHILSKARDSHGLSACRGSSAGGADGFRLTLEGFLCASPGSSASETTRAPMKRRPRSRSATFTSDK
jgi:hypothetical protein